MNAIPHPTPRSTETGRPGIPAHATPHLTASLLTPRTARRRRSVLPFTLGGLALALVVGCATGNRAAPPLAGREPQPQTLRAGDVVKISFPGAPTLDTTQQIRHDGKINLYLVGEVQAASVTPADLEKQLVQAYATQVVSKEVRVTLVASAFSVFVTGAVVRPGKLTPERSLTAFEAIMEAGGFDNGKADTKAVMIIRQEAGQTRNFTLNLKALLDGKPTEPFYLQAYDIVYVPEKFSWF